MRCQSEKEKITGDYYIIPFKSYEECDQLLFAKCPICGYWNHKVGNINPQRTVEMSRENPMKYEKCLNCHNNFLMRK